jgi:hypothetical protein
MIYKMIYKMIKKIYKIINKEEVILHLYHQHQIIKINYQLITKIRYQ